MKIEMMKMLGVAVVVGAMAMVGCSKKPDTEPVKAPGAAERAGAALDRAADKTADVTANAVKKATEATKEALRQGAPGGGFILSSSNSIHSAVKPENYQALVNTWKEYGCYPLKLSR